MSAAQEHPKHLLKAAGQLAAAGWSVLPPQAEKYQPPTAQRMLQLLADLNPGPDVAFWVDPRQTDDLVVCSVGPNLGEALTAAWTRAAAQYQKAGG